MDETSTSSSTSQDWKLSLQVNIVVKILIISIICKFKQYLIYHRLTVTDEAGLMDVAYTNVSVKTPHDYPPIANAGQPVRIIHLPYNTIVLDGSQSKDDKGIVKYSWKQVKGKLAETKVCNNTVIVNKRMSYCIVQ